MELDDLPSHHVRYLKEVQRRAGHTDALELIHRLGIPLKPSTHTFSLPAYPAIFARPEFLGGNNDALRHELAHVLLYSSGLQTWLEECQNEIDETYFLEWLCDRSAAFFASGQAMVDDVLSEHGVTASAVLALNEVTRCGIEKALARIVQDDPAHTRAGFIVKSGMVTGVEQCNFRLPFWKWQRLSASDAFAAFPPEVTVSAAGCGRGFVGVVSV